MTRRFLWTVTILASLAAGGTPRAFGAAASEGPVLATVNGQPITQEELVQAYAQLDAGTFIQKG